MVGSAHSSKHHHQQECCKTTLCWTFEDPWPVQTMTLSPINCNHCWLDTWCTCCRGTIQQQKTSLHVYRVAMWKYSGWFVLMFIKLTNMRKSSKNSFTSHSYIQWGFSHWTILLAIDHAKNHLCKYSNNFSFCHERFGFDIVLDTNYETCLHTPLTLGAIPTCFLAFSSDSQRLWGNTCVEARHTRLKSTKNVVNSNNPLKRRRFKLIFHSIVLFDKIWHYMTQKIFRRVSRFFFMVLPIISWYFDGFRRISTQVFQSSKTFLSNRTPDVIFQTSHQSAKDNLFANQYFFAYMQ